MLLSHVFCPAAGHQWLGCVADRFYQDRQFHQDSPEYSLPLPIVRVMGYSAMLRLHRLVCCSHFGLHWDSQRGLADVLGRYSRAGLTQHPCLVETEALVPALVAADRVVAFSIGLSWRYPSMTCEPRHIIRHSLAISPILSDFREWTSKEEVRRFILLRPARKGQ